MASLHKGLDTNHLAIMGYGKEAPIPPPPQKKDKRNKDKWQQQTQSDHRNKGIHGKANENKR